jgi:ubiquinol-cytochrome c reductase cytochrome b subunit
MAEIDPHSNEDSVPFYPDHVSNEAKVVIGISILALGIGLIGLFAPIGLGEPADPMNTPAHIKPEWYFWVYTSYLSIFQKQLEPSYQSSQSW